MSTLGSVWVEGLGFGPWPELLKEGYMGDYIRDDYRGYYGGILGVQIMAHVGVSESWTLPTRLT